MTAITPTWAWWVVRDDGDRCAGPFGTQAEAERIWRNVFDTSEYRVDYQYAVADGIECGRTDAAAPDLLRALEDSIAKARAERDSGRRLSDG